MRGDDEVGGVGANGDSAEDQTQPHGIKIHIVRGKDGHSHHEGDEGQGDEDCVQGCVSVDGPEDRQGDPGDEDEPHRDRECRDASVSVNEHVGEDEDDDLCAEK